MLRTSIEHIIRVSRALRAKSRHRAKNLNLESIMNFHRNRAESSWNLIQNPLQDDPKSLKINLWGFLGALWRPSWRQCGTWATTTAQKLKKYQIIGSSRGSKMNPRRVKWALSWTKSGPSWIMLALRLRLGAHLGVFWSRIEDEFGVMFGHRPIVKKYEKPSVFIGSLLFWRDWSGWLRRLRHCFESCWVAWGVFGAIWVRVSRKIFARMSPRWVKWALS